MDEVDIVLLLFEAVLIWTVTFAVLFGARQIMTDGDNEFEDLPFIYFISSLSMFIFVFLDVFYMK